MGNYLWPMFGYQIGMVMGYFDCSLKIYIFKLFPAEFNEKLTTVICLKKETRQSEQKSEAVIFIASALFKFALAVRKKK